MSLSSLVNKDRKFVSKVWGYEDWLCNSPLYCGKTLFIKKSKRLSLHYHKLKTETFFVQSGKVIVNLYSDPKYDSIFTTWDSFHKFTKGTALNHGIETLVLEAGDTLMIPVTTRHTVFAELDSYVFEFSTQHFDEDSIRILAGY
jgi:mannose-6-phosphate isomerase-like protein (cupin superfamily)